MRAIVVAAVVIAVVAAVVFTSRNLVSDVDDGSGRKIDVADAPDLVRKAGSAITRLQFVNSLKRKALADPESSEGDYSVAGSDNTELIFEASSITSDHCGRIAKSKVGEQASTIGFTLLTCRGRADSAEFQLTLDH
jgi:hypothetical protein